MNRNIILAVADAIENETLHLGFDMRHTVEHIDCQTVACIAGHAVCMFNKDGTLRTKPLTGAQLIKQLRFGGAMKTAQNIMGLSPKEANDLFLAWDYDAPLRYISPAVAVTCLRNLAKTGRVGWPATT